MKVLKRDGRIVDFNSNKIISAISKAMLSVQDILTQEDLLVAEKIAQEIEHTRRKTLNVEDIQNLIERKLMNSSRKDVAKAYIIYRSDRTRIRESNSQLMQEVANKMEAKNIENQNANVDERSFGGRLGQVNSVVAKQYALDNCMTEMAKTNHLNNEIYIHDLDAYAVGSHNCTVGESFIKIKHNNIIQTLKIEDLANQIGMKNNQICYLEKDNYSILSRDGWTKLISITKRAPKQNELLYTIRTRSGIPIKLTGEHRLPIIKEGKEIIEEVKNLVKGDFLLDIEQLNLSEEEIANSFLDLTQLDDEFLDLRISNPSILKSYLKFKYNIVFTKFAKEHNFELPANAKSIKIKDFKKILQEYPLSFDVISSLKIRACGSKNEYPLYIPYSPELAKIYAYIYADGGVYVKEQGSLYQLTFTNTNEELVDDFVKCYESVFGKHLNKSYPASWHTSPCIRVTDGSRLIVKLFKDFAGAKKYCANNISMPNFVLNGDRKIKLAYLSACIDTDGTLSTDICYTSCCETYLHQLAFILKDLGYHSHVNLQYKAGSVYRFGKKSGTRNYDCYIIRINRNDEKMLLQSELNTFKYNDSYSYKGISNNFNENKITSITTEILQENVYDIETLSHWFIVNNYVSHNCLSVPFDKLLANGFNTRQTDVRPANSVNTACQLIAVIFQLQSLQQFGGVSATHLDWTLVPYVRKSFYKHFKTAAKYMSTSAFYKILNERFDEIFDNQEISIDKKEFITKLQEVIFINGEDDISKCYTYAYEQTEKELKQAIEALYHNLNTLQSRSGNQLPFTSLNYGTCTLTEGRMVTKALLDGSIEGLGKFHKTSVFPCGIFKIKDGVNKHPGEPNYDLYKLALKSTALRLYPNYANVDWSGNQGYDENDPATEFSTMGCRTANGWDINGFGQLKDGRGNICPVTIILPTLAMESKGEVGNKDIDDFMSILDTKINEAKDMLIERFEWICSQPMESARFMYENGLMEGYVPEEGIRSALKHGTLAIGQLALAETLEILIGTNQTTESGMKLAKKIEQLFKDKCAKFKEEYKLNFGVYYTPAENLCYTAMNKFKKQYGELKNISDHKYFTNSIHIPVWEKVDLFTKVDLESQLTSYSSAGCITYVEMDSNLENNIEALEEIVTYAMDKDIPYFAINVPNDLCNECGYTGKIDDTCPKCGSTNISRLRRVTGYLTGDYKTAFNKGKQAEVEERVKHTGVEVT